MYLKITQEEIDVMKKAALENPIGYNSRPKNKAMAHTIDKKLFLLLTVNALPSGPIWHLTIRHMEDKESADMDNVADIVTRIVNSCGVPGAPEMSVLKDMPQFKWRLNQDEIDFLNRNKTKIIIVGTN